MNRFRRSTVLLMALMAAWGWIGSAQLQAHTGHSEQVRQISLQISRHRASHQKKGSSAILVSLLLRRGDMYRRMRRFRRSLRDLREVSRLQPENRQAVLSRAMCFHEMRSYRRARREIDRYIEGGDATGNALILRAQLHQRAGRLAEATADLDGAVALGGTPDTYLQRGRMLVRLGRLDDAARGYEAGLKALGGAVVLRLPLIDVEIQRGRFKRALELVNALLSRAPVKAPWLLRRARIYQAAAMPREAAADNRRALQDAEALIRLRPTALNRLLRAKAYLASGRVAPAIRDLRRVVAAAPRLEEARALLDRALAEAKKEPQ